ncbi:phosphatidylinositol N-acetylglucosaminyltransferase [Punctularia strigosozonata HHB-11173 SS5]|uniref:phosphatidylinositol N-acetylglucosaminyltransferase n=1 Tax=Punctularia strigosozonata (strain HHB-11173) TaxID=741275 RepID=UPI00044173E2|nr:phosphatidylinositol N-acetylglucosaminyltransferase [Punctularia strigosozonata HHB-11173 SS5]EIN13728.1 phosphatidylinositol N-acetylglucosaminyltransferase [Punctularia strigosozonata HHB-11173 SS5]
MSSEWERVLWKRQPYPDNYVPPSFLSELRKNPSFRPYTYRSLVVGSFAISQHFSTIFIFLAVFVRLHTCVLDPRLLVWMSVGVFVSGYAVWEILDYVDVRNTPRDLNENRAKVLKSSILVFLALLALSPVLKTLTAATSSDSIWALSAFLFILNALLADYSSAKPEGRIRERLTSVLSMNAAISASVVLASRLPDNLSVFALILFAIQVFSLFPILRHRLQATPLVLQTTLTAALCSLSLFLSSIFPSTVTWVFAAVFGFYTFGAPAMLMWAQRYKNEIRGPWDVAVPKVN